MKISKMIAYQSVDCEGDVSCNEALLFPSQKDANEFLKNSKLVIETLELKIQEYEDIDSCISVFENESGDVYEVLIRLEYCGSLTIEEMKVGYVISNPKNA